MEGPNKPADRRAANSALDICAIVKLVGLNWNFRQFVNMVISRNSHAGYFKYHRITIKMLWGFHRCHVGRFFLFFFGINSWLSCWYFLGKEFYHQIFGFYFLMNLGEEFLFMKSWDFWISLTSLVSLGFGWPWLPWILWDLTLCDKKNCVFSEPGDVKNPYLAW